VEGKVRYTARAEADLDSIAAYTFEKWGIEQATEYVRNLEASCRSLSDPKRGRVCRPLPMYRRFEHAKHVIYFRRDQRGDVLIVRILHERMLAALHLTGEDE
jgi:toxin ParE1/3/4